VNHVALVDHGSGPLLVGTARYIVEHSETRPKSAEVAFVVGDAHQRLGIGDVLLRHLAAIAGVLALYNEVISDTNNQQTLEQIVRARYGETSGLLSTRA
jgi:GNAT superfamily N-acetyltransferase